MSNPVGRIPNRSSGRAGLGSTVLGLVGHELAVRLANRAGLGSNGLGLARHVLAVGPADKLQFIEMLVLQCREWALPIPAV